MKVYRDRTKPNDYEWHEVYPPDINGWRVTVKKVGLDEIFRVMVSECGLTVLETTEELMFFAEEVDELRLYW